MNDEFPVLLIDNDKDGECSMCFECDGVKDGILLTEVLNKSEETIQTMMEFLKAQEQDNKCRQMTN